MSLEAGGRYPATVTAATMTESEAGNPGIWINFQTSSGEIAETFTITGNTLEMVERTLRNLGVDTDTVDVNDLVEDPGKYLINAECEITLKEETYNGRVRLRVQWVNQKRRTASSTARQKAAGLLGRLSARGSPSGPSFGAAPAPETKPPF